MKKIFTKLLSVFICALMIAYLLPTSVYASAINRISKPTVQEQGQSMDGDAEPYAIGEDISLRNENTKYIRMSDGSYHVAMYETAVHYLNEDGDWDEIDNTLVSSSSNDTGDFAGVSNLKGKWSVKFANNSSSSKLVAIKDSEYKLSFHLVNANKSKAATVIQPDLSENDESSVLERILIVKKGISRVKYSDILDGVDIEYVMVGNSIKENIIVKNKSGNYQYVFDMKLNKLTAELIDEKSIVIKDEKSGDVVYTMTAPYMVDANGEYSSNVSYRLEKVKNKEYRVTVLADETWMNEESRAFPVTIDPPISTGGFDTQNVDDAHVKSGSPDQTFNSEGYLYAGYDSNAGAGKNRIFWRLNTPPSIPSNSVIVDAKLSLGQLSNNGYSAVASANFLTLALRKVVGRWNAETITWSNMPKVEDTIYDYQNTNATLNGQYLTWDVTAIAKAWHSGEENNGVAIYPDVEYDGQGNGKWANARFISCNMPSNRSLAPIFTVTYRNTTGLEDYYTYQTQSIGRAGVGYISDYTSQLTLVNTDIVKSSTILSFNINHIYNDGHTGSFYTGITATGASTESLANYGNMKLGYGWKLNIQETVYSVTFQVPKTSSKESYSVTYLVYNDGDGTEHYFWGDQDQNPNLFVDEDGLGLEISKSNNTYVMKDAKDNVKTFVNGLLYKVSDANGNTIKIVYNTSNGQPTTGANRIVRVVRYNSGYQTESSAETIATFTYDSYGNLTSIKDSIDRSTDFTYVGNLLTAVQYPDSQTIQYGYQYKTVNSQQIAFLSTAYDAESKYGIQYTRGSNWNPYAVTYVKEYYSNGTIVQYGQEFSVTNTFGEKTEYRYSGPDSINGNADDIIVTYLFDFNGRSANVYTTDVTYNTVYGASTVTYTPNASEGTSLFKQRNRISSLGSIGVAPRNYIADGSIEFTGTTLYMGGSQGTYWSSFGSTSSISASITSLKPRTGNYSIKLTSTSASSDEAGYTYNTGNMTLKAGQTYTFSAHVNLESFSGLSSGGVYLKVASVSETFVGNKVKTDLTTDLIENNWQRLSVTFTPTVNGVFNLSCCVVNATGTAYFDDFQLEETSAPSSYNMISNGAMRTEQAWYTGTNANSEFAAAFIEDIIYNSISISGKMTSPSYSFQDINVGKSSNTTFILSGWAYAKSVTLEDTHKFNAEPVRFSLSACIEYSDGVREDHFINFNPDIMSEWQYTSGVIVPKRANQTINKITVYLNYGFNANNAFFRDIALVEEEVQTYSYDDNGNLIAATQTDNSTITSSYENNNITSISQNNKNYEYTYKTAGNKHLLDTVKNAGVTMKFTYDSAGNVTGTTISGISYDKTLISSTSYTINGNAIGSSTDASGITKSYLYNDRGLLVGETDANSVTMRYDYHAGNDRQTVAYISGLVSASYNYLNGALDNIIRGGYIAGDSEKKNQIYTFNRDNFGNVTSVKVGNYTLVTYTYGSKNGHLTRTTYGNGTYIDNVYDKLDRVVEIKVNGETKYKYTYAGNGDLYSIEDIDSDIKFCYNYDSLDRLISSYQLIGSNITLLTQYDYDNENRVSVYHCGIEGAAGGTLGHTYSYTYNSNDGNLSKISVTGNNIYGDNLVYTYDNLKRLSKKSITGQYRTLAQEYGYRNISSTRTTLQIQDLTWTLQGTTTLAYSYTYDAIGNITEIRKDGSLVASYTYDSQSQLKSETLYDQDLFYTYNYDSYGNIRSVYKRQYSTNALINYESYDYNDSSWLDKLTSYNGTSITYDSIGNPLSYYNGGSYSFTWTSGRKLQTSSHNGVNSFYAYNVDGQRIKKICSGTIYNYYYSDGALVRQTGGGNTIDFLYDENGSVYSIVYNGTQYYLVKNLQGDVTQIRSVYGTVLVEYAYDAWGNVLDISGTYASTLGQNNPIRYRGYYYDSETSLYYLNSRYYDPANRRFINADNIGYLGAGSNLTGYNLFAYCGNNPVMGYDPYGTFDWSSFGKGAGWLAIGITAICVGVSVLTCGVATPAIMAVAAVTVAAGAATAVNGVSELGEAATGHNFMRDDVFRGNAKAYNTYAHTTAAVAEIGTMVCGGWLKANAPRIEAYNNVQNYTYADGAAKHVGERSYYDSTLLKKEIIKYGTMTNEGRGVYTFRAAGTAFSNVRQTFQSGIWELTTINGKGLIGHFLLRS